MFFKPFVVLFAGAVFFKSREWLSQEEARRCNEALFSLCLF